MNDIISNNRYFALGDALLVSELPGSIEITEEQYNKATEAKMTGREAFVRDDQLVIFSGIKINTWDKKTRELKERDEFEELPVTHTNIEPVGDVVWESDGWVERIKSPSELAIVEHAWVRAELQKVDVELALHNTEDRRAKYSLDAWKQYARELRDYTSTNEVGEVTVNFETRPSIIEAET